MKYLLFIIFLMQFFKSSAQDFAGVWKGDLVIDKETLALIIHIKQEDAQWCAYMDIPVQDAFKVPAKLSIENNKFHIETEAEINIKGEMTSADELRAVFLQSGFKKNLKFSRVLDTNQLFSSYSLKRPQEPSAPFPYDSRDFTVEDDRVKLSGTITIPKGEGKFPALILVSGSGTHDRDGEMYGHKPFKVLADYLTRRGIIVMRFDDIGIGGSVGNEDYETILTNSMDVNILLNRLKLEPKVNLERMGLLGHSVGSLISLLVTAQNTDVKFFASLAGMGLSGKKVMKKQNEEKLAGVPLEKKQLYYNLMEVMGESDNDDFTRKKMQDIINNYKGEDSLNAIDTMSFSQIFTPWILCTARLNPADYIRQIKVPVLVLQGGKDTQVLAKENVAVFRKELPKNSKTFIKIYPELNHLFQKAKTGSRMEYKQIDETFNEVVMYDIAEWIEKL